MKIRAWLILSVGLFLLAALPVGAEKAPWVEHTTISGMKILLQRTDSELAEVSLLLKSGSGLDPHAKQGTALVMNSLVNLKLNSGSDEYGDIEVNTFPDYTVINFATTREDLSQVLREVRQLLTQPLYNYDMIMDLKELYSTDLLAISPWAKVYQKFGEYFYGTVHPYSERMDSATLKKIKGADVYRWYRKTYQPGNAILSITGGTQLSLKKIAKIFKQMQSETVDQRLLVEPVIPGQNQTVEFEDPNGRIATLCMGYAAPRLQDSEYPAFRVLNYYLENFQHYFEELRVKEGLMYTGFVYYNYLEKPNAPSMVFMTMTDRDTLPKVETKTVQLVNDLITEGIDQSQIDQVVRTLKAEAKNQAMAGTGLAYRNALGEYLQTALLYEVNSLPLLEKVTTKDIKKAAAKYLQHYVRVAYIPVQQAKDLYR
jgi:predicted Zn-dependent peptidase